MSDKSNATGARAPLTIDVSDAGLFFETQSDKNKQVEAPSSQAAVQGFDEEEELWLPSERPLPVAPSEMGLKDGKSQQPGGDAALLSTLKAPLSPHLTIYKLQWSSFLSITHRLAEGLLFMLALFLSGLAFFIVFLVDTRDQFWLLVRDFSRGIGGRLFWFAVGSLLFYYSAGVLRHALLDRGFLFAPRSLARWGVCFVSLAAVFTILWGLRLFYAG